MKAPVRVLFCRMIAERQDSGPGSQMEALRHLPGAPEAARHGVRTRQVCDYCDGHFCAIL